MKPYIDGAKEVPMNSPLLALASATMVAVTAYAGGWATVTVKHMPE
jgi:hypothetical protein